MITKAEALQIDALLTEVVRKVGANAVDAVGRAREALERATEGRTLPKQLKLAVAYGVLPGCSHGRSLMDWSGEQLVPPCGCRLVEPTATEPAIERDRYRYAKVWTIDEDAARHFFGQPKSVRVVVLKDGPQTDEERAKWIPSAKLFGVVIPTEPSSSARSGTLGTPGRRKKGSVR